MNTPPPDLTIGDQHTIDAVRNWVASVVVGLNLCPFAGRELLNHRVRFIAVEASSSANLLASLKTELHLLEAQLSIETTLLIHPHVLHDFHHYNDFLDRADHLLTANGWRGMFQIASFHPGYQFEGTAPADPENYSNRSPYPLLHLLREASVAQAIATYPHIHDIPARNIAQMNRIGADALRRKLAACLTPRETD